MTTFGTNGMYENGLAGEALDLEGATVEAAPELGENESDPLADAAARQHASDGTPVGLADAEADATPN